MQLVIVDIERIAEHPHQLAGEVLRQDLGGDITLAQGREQQRELVARGAGQHQILLWQGLEPLHHGPQQQIAAGVAEGVVDRLEVVEIQQQQCPPLSARGEQGTLQDVVQAAPVVEAGQIVVIGEPLDVAGRLFFLGDVVEAADEMGDAAGPILDHAHHEPHREEVAALVQALLLAQPELLPEHGRDDLVPQAVAIVGGSQRLEVKADHLIVPKAGDAGEGGIDLEDDAVVIHHQQAIVGIEGHLRQAQGIVTGEALQLDGRAFTLAV
ncbi:hypothetical protein D3C76_961910 [compost metagenome]